jgi:hypothetical protein
MPAVRRTFQSAESGPTKSWKPPRKLQSVNEELTSVNGELALRVQEVGRANSDLKTLLESTQIALVERSIAYELEGKQPWGSTKGACIARSSCH